MSNLQKTIVVTGASSGFGRDTAERCSGEGWRVFTGVRSARTKHAKAAAELEQRGIRVVELKITDQGSVAGAAAEMLAAGFVDVLVNNAGAA